MPSNALREWVKVMTPVRTADGAGGYVETFEEARTVRAAKVAELFPREMVEGGALQAKRLAHWHLDGTKGDVKGEDRLEELDGTQWKVVGAGPIQDGIQMVQGEQVTRGD